VEFEPFCELVLFFSRGYYICNYCKEKRMTTLKVVAVGNSVGVILPKELAERLRVTKGDTLYATQTPDGIQLTPYDPDFARQMELAERVMREDRDALRKLAE
jgi:putative addiction module antidote